MSGVVLAEVSGEKKMVSASSSRAATRTSEDESDEQRASAYPSGGSGSAQAMESGDLGNESRPYTKAQRDGGDEIAATHEFLAGPLFECWRTWKTFGITEGLLEPHSGVGTLWWGLASCNSALRLQTSHDHKTPFRGHGLFEGYKALAA